MSYRRAPLGRRLSVLLVLALVAGPLAILSSRAASPAPQTVKAYLLSQPTSMFGPGLEAALNATKPNERINVLVMVNDMELQESDSTLLAGMGFTNLIRYRILPVIAAWGTPAMIQKAATNPRIRRIEINKQLDYHLNRSTKTVKADEGVWDRYIKQGNQIGLPITGEGVTVAVVDTGVDATHPDLRLGSKTVANKDFIGQSLVGFVGDPEPHGEWFDAVGLWADVLNSDTSSVHGTHVAGIAAGNGSASANSPGVTISGSADATTRRGVAPGAKILGLGAGEGLSVIHNLAAYDFIYDHIIETDNAFNIRVINNSFGGAGEFDQDAFLSIAVMILSYDMDAYAPPGRRFNQHVVFSAGNDGQDGEDTTNLWGRIPVTISVANTSKNGLPPNDAANTASAVASDSSLGVSGRPETYPDVAAPGSNIFSTLAHAGGSAQQYIGLHGTSMAAPHVAGGIALMLQANPDLTLAGVADDFGASAPAQYQNPFLNGITEAEWILKATASHVAGAYGNLPGAAYLPGQTHSINEGYGLINLEKAVAVALALRKLRATNPAATIGAAIAAANAPGFIQNVNETHVDSNQLATAWSGTAITVGTPAVFVPQGYSLTVPPSGWTMKLTLRWKQLADLDLRLSYTDSTNTARTSLLTDVAAPTTDGVKTIEITDTSCGAGNTCTNYSTAIKNNPARPWVVQILTETVLAYNVDWQVTAELTHTGSWTVGRNSTIGAANGPDTVIRWGDWHDAENGCGPTHAECDAPAQHTIEMRYYDLGSVASLGWASPGFAPGGSSKFDPNAQIADANLLPTKTVRLSQEAWRSWHGGTPPPSTTTITYTGPANGQYTDSAPLSATLTYLGLPLPGKTVTFTLGAQTANAITNGAGVASVPMTLLQVPGAYSLTTSFAGDGPATPSIDTDPFTINKEDTAIALVPSNNGTGAKLTATLTDADSSAGVPGRTIPFSQGGNPLGDGVTNVAGIATKFVANANRSLGSYGASFAGDAFFLPSGLVGAPLPAPPAPVIIFPATGTSFATCSVTVSGTAEPGATVTILSNGLPVGTTTAAGDGSWSIVLCLPDGSHVLTATATDAASVTGPASAPVSILVDTVAPVAPVVNGVCGTTISSNATTVSGVGEPGTILTITFTGPSTTVVRTARVAADGTWTVHVIFAEPGAFTLNAVLTDAAGNVSPAASCSLTVDFDATPPAAPVITSPANNALVPGTFTVTGTAPADAVNVFVYDTGQVLIGSAPASGGAWSLQTTLSSGIHTLTARAADAAGNVSVPSAAVQVTVDGEGPKLTVNSPSLSIIAQPVIPIWPWREVRGSASDAISGVTKVKLEYKPILLGQAKTVDNACTACPSAPGKTVFWSDTTQLAIGLYDVTVTAFDAAGNTTSVEHLIVYVMR